MEFIRSLAETIDRCAGAICELEAGPFFGLNAHEGVHCVD